MLASEALEQCLQRRNALIDKLQPNSIAIFPAAHMVTRSNDTEYPFRQNSNFHYLTHFPEPDAVLVLSNLASLGSHFCALFCLPKNPDEEVWHGRRIGVEAAKQQFGFSQTHSLDDLHEYLDDYIEGHQQIYLSRAEDPQLAELIDTIMEGLVSAPKQSRSAPHSVIDIRPLIHAMRLIKSDYEINAMRQAAGISAEAHKHAMLQSKVGNNEYHLEAELHYRFALQGARHPAYGTIVGSGNNACILHYTENDAELKDGDLVLIDAGAEWQGYAADITRTFPVNGRFSPEQTLLYQLVLDAQTVSFEYVRPGGNFQQATDAAARVLTQGLIELGILQGSLQHNLKLKTYRQFFIHGLGHWLGLDVHDVGSYKQAGEDIPFQPGMVLTIEPGLYISQDAKVEAKWQGIGIRIEDNLLITASGHEVLTATVPKTIDEIQTLMAGNHA